MTATPPTQLRRPRVAELVAAELRDRILTGQLTDGSLLPKQEVLFKEFGISPASLREALRILETEGLVTVPRGNAGGVVIHRPQLERAAYMFALVMEARSVTLADVSRALSRLDPACAAECATRPDRARTVVPRLRKVLRESKAAIEEPLAYMVSARRFHEEMVSSCGNETMILMVGTLESLWGAQVRSLLRDTADPIGDFADLATRRASLELHEALFERIVEGDSAGAEQLARDHLREPATANYGFPLDRPVTAGVLDNARPHGKGRV
jgi:GntR family transcriptional repressor for pyruvate dehydrogenase complex